MRLAKLCRAELTITETVDLDFCELRRPYPFNLSSLSLDPSPFASRLRSRSHNEPPARRRVQDSPTILQHSPRATLVTSVGRSNSLEVPAMASSNKRFSLSNLSLPLSSQPASRSTSPQLVPLPLSSPAARGSDPFGSSGQGAMVIQRDDMQKQLRALE